MASYQAIFDLCPRCHTMKTYIPAYGMCTPCLEKKRSWEKAEEELTQSHMTEDEVAADRGNVDAFTSEK